MLSVLFFFFFPLRSKSALWPLQLYSLRCGSVTLHFLLKEHLSDTLNILATVIDGILVLLFLLALVHIKLYNLVTCGKIIIPNV